MSHTAHNIKLIRKLSQEGQEEFRKRFTNISIGKQKSYERGAAEPGILYVSELSKLSGVVDMDLIEKKLQPADIKNQFWKVNKDEKVSRETDTQEIVEPEHLQKGVQIAEDDQSLTTRAIYNLTESERMRAESEVIREKNHSRMIALLEANFEADKLSLKEIGDTVRALRTYTVDLAAEVRKQSKIAAMQSLNTLVKPADALGENSGTHVGASKKHKG